jgi:hypothetical protein
VPNGSLTDYAENQTLNWLLTTNAVTRPTQWYVALFTVSPSDTGGGTEVAGNAYARQAVTFSVSGTNPTQAANTANIEFATATASWGAIASIGVFDAPTGGNMLAEGLALNPVTGLADAETVNTGNIYRLNAGDLVVTMD